MSRVAVLDAQGRIANLIVCDAAFADAHCPYGWTDASARWVTPGRFYDPASDLISKTRGVPDGYALQAPATAPWAYRGAGPAAYRFEVRSGYQANLDRNRSSPVERCELSGWGSMIFDLLRDYRISYEMLVETGAPNTASWVILGQAHATEDAGEPSVSPPFAIHLQPGDMLAINHRSGDNTLAPYPAENLTVLGKLARGVWHSFELRLRFDPNGDGAVDLLLDGSPAFSYRGQLGYADAMGPYWKYGIYRAAASEPLAVQYRCMAILAL